MENRIVGVLETIGAAVVGGTVFSISSNRGTEERGESNSSFLSSRKVVTWLYTSQQIYHQYSFLQITFNHKLLILLSN